MAFQMGVLLLASSLLLAVPPLFWALLQGSRCHRRPWWSDKLNLVFALIAGLMLLGAPWAHSGWLAWVGLGNWLPFFWGFWGFQPYMATAAARRRVALLFIASTIPVLITGIGQLFFGWSGPWQALGGLLIWHMAPGGMPLGRLSGLFDYANITAAWLSFSWPLLLAAALESWRRFPWLLLLVVSHVGCLYLTDSRNGWGAAVLAVPLLLGPGRWLWLMPLFLLLLLPVLFAVLPGVPELLQNGCRFLVPEAIWVRLSDIAFSDRPMASTRLGQWQVAAGLVAERPWLGWGAAAFSLIYPIRTGVWHGHPHNLPLDLAISHGMPAALLLIAVVLWLLLRATSLGINQAGLFERAWWAAVLILVLLHATDLPLYDGRVNVAGWLLLAGLRAACWPQGFKPS
ncbi:MAG: O-antigen ligase domain-containing protein [Synechococcaceae bacterium WB5_2B_268]|nr:O-antigen ligase domain-containing protein [Synechococcaceae bacterium WB5_2B_268]